MAGRKTPLDDRSLFDASFGREDKSLVPLAERMRPRKLEDLVGQTALLSPTSPLARAVESDRVRSMILWGPPGSGKTTLARVVAERTRARFVSLNAVLSGVPEVRQIVAEAKEAKKYTGARTILFVDEIHRFNKAQQDAFLPHVEDGSLTLIGATTENPSFAVNAPLLSRCKVYRLSLLTEEAIVQVLRRAVESPTGLNGAVEVDDDALVTISKLAQGDARRALTSLEIAADEVLSREETRVSVENVAMGDGEKTLLYDKTGEEHYNVISAFIKSMRGSDPDASIYYLMRMLEAGDDPLFLLRRMIIFASEDVGNADPRGLEIALAADVAFRRIGMPEGLYPISHACLYLATAPKSNSVGKAYQGAQAMIAEHGALPVPMHLRNATTRLMKDEGYGKGYRYPHDEEGGVAEGASYLPEKLKGTLLYEPSTRGYEKMISERLAYYRQRAGTG